MESCKRFLGLFLVVLLVSASVFSKEPAWISDSEAFYKLYPEEEYIAQIGYGSTIQDAQSDAVMRVVQFFDSKISATFEDFNVLFSSEDGVTEYSEVKNEVKIQSDVDLFAFEYSQPYKSKSLNQYCIVAYINREKAFEMYEPKLKKASDLFNSVFLKSRNVDDPLEKIIRMYAAYNSSLDFFEKYEFANLISSDLASAYSMTYNQIISYYSELEELKQKVSFVVDVEGDNGTKIKSKLTEIVCKLGFSVQNESDYSVTAKVNCDVSFVQSDYGDVYTSYPCITVEFSNGNKTLYVYEKNLKKVSAFSKSKTYDQSYLKLEKELDDSFINDFYTSVMKK